MATITAVGYGAIGYALIERFGKRFGVPIKTIPARWWQLSDRYEIRFRLNDEVVYYDLALEIARAFVISSGSVTLYKDGDFMSRKENKLGPMEIVAMSGASLPDRSWEILALAQESHDRREREELKSRKTKDRREEFDWNPYDPEKLTADDKRLMYMLSEANSGSVVLPSGMLISIDEVKRWVAQNPR